jgi:ABC-2 type transport system permease protein
MNGVATVARLELTMRLRTGRWRALLAVWFVVLAGFTVLMRLAIGHTNLPSANRGTVLYGSLQLFLLAIALLIMPALACQSVNGERERGTLAALQVSRLSAFEIAAGKLLAAWGAGFAFLAVSAPIVAWCMSEGGVPAVRVLAVSVVVTLLIGVVCAVALGLSAWLSRTTTSAVLSYLAVFALTFGTLIAFGIATAMTVQQRSVHFSVPANLNAPSGCCQSVEPVERTDLTWWLLAPNPFVVLADAAPVSAAQSNRPVCHTVTFGGQTSTDCVAPATAPDPLGAIGRAVRALRAGPPPAFSPLGPTPPRRGGVVWPYGLGIDLLLGAGMLTLATRRLRTPYARLPKGVRIA